jgi:hypothetical protein
MSLNVSSSSSSTFYFSLRQSTNPHPFKAGSALFSVFPNTLCSLSLSQVVSLHVWCRSVYAANSRRNHICCALKLICLLLVTLDI